MWDVSARWDEAVRNGWSALVSKAEVWHEGVFSGTVLDIVGGGIQISEDSKVRRSLRLTSSNIEMEPDDAADLLAPFGTDLHIFSGGRYAEGDEELVPCGVFRLGEIDRPSFFAGLEIQADDYSAVTALARLIQPWNVSPGSTVAQVMQDLLEDALGAVDFFDLTDGDGDTVMPVTTWERERWDAIESIATSIGAEPLFDQQGRPLLRPTPEVDPTAASAWVVDANNDRAVLLDVATGMNSDRVYNLVVASNSSATTDPVSAFVFQSTGELAYRPGFKRPRFFASPLLGTTAACEKAARTILARSILWERRMDPVAVPNPALDVGDQIDVVLPDGTTSQRIVSSIDLPLGPGSMSLTTRVGVTVESVTTTGDLS